ncbi:hypothetical protein J27TS8_43740 [Robertmurraya siralis]|uniref:WYL domain-containing protein n=1 Tax=Robertmurraya siralis TaxID=77777 RepID=A0A919WME9_9BACI|nr:hypothetical protein [Robertmurraya siralis]PAE20701.1 hypothetical protein CHH80_10490 [Bacillus sp. 7504-2]GIN64381.1 hypothetical protein J27TS8_43740 [Robertmurraya siralis]
MSKLLTKSLEEQIPVEMIYISSSNQITQRKIIVKEINGSMVRAYCFMRRQTRLFKIEQILSLMPVRTFHKEIS